MRLITNAREAMPVAMTPDDATLWRTLTTGSAQDGDRVALVADRGEAWLDQWSQDCRLGAAAALDLARTCRTARVQLHSNDGGALHHWDVRLTRVAKLAAVIAVARDVTAAAHEYALLKRVAYCDGLTGLHNRGALRQQLADAVAVAAACDGSVALFMLDLDNFKLINDTLGHDAGDALLVEAANRLRATASHPAIAGRLGGDEFAVIVPSATLRSDVSPLAEAFLEAMRLPVSYKGRVLDTRVSIGIAQYPQHGTEPSELFKNADTALYSAKSFGRGGFTTYVRSMGSAIQRRAAAVEQVQDAMAHGRIAARYHPIMDLNNSTVIGFEAKASADDADGVPIPPAAMYWAAEDVETARQLGETVVDRAVSDVAAWHAAGLRPGHIALNAAAAELRTGDYASRLLSRIALAGLSPTQFEIEVCEAVLNGRGSDHMASALHDLSAAGMQITLAEFGSGAASLAQVKRLPFRAIKIDHRFVASLVDDEGDQAIVRAIIGLAGGLRLRVSAAGVDTPEQFALLATFGCTLGQGDCCGVSLSADAVREMLKVTGCSP